MSQKKKILIVDDERFFRDILKDALEDHYDIIEGENGDEAISLAMTQKPNLIIMDVTMPVKDGVDACLTLKERTETRKIP
ncbi:MAG: response regulator, partial [Desulfuromonadales bacterium]|nr:response regulator [Desulfuromonadales bacterium]